MDEIVLQLTRADAEQLLNHLHNLLANWQYTEQILNGGPTDNNKLFMAATEAHEAAAIVDYYRQRIAALENQLKQKAD